MDHPDRRRGPYFSQPVRQITLMLISLGLVGAGVYLALPRVLPVFTANLALNFSIVCVFAVGVLACFWQVFQLIYSVRWIEAFAREGVARGDLRVPRLLLPLATLLESRAQKTQISATSTRSILDSVATRIDEAREITRYIVNLLIFLGLLGTFYGLATTVPALVETIRSLAPQEGEAGVAVFARLMSGLENQLDGMGVAFSSSLLGLAGSLVVGLLELFASHGQNRFYRELEDWLSTITRLSFGTGDGEGSIEQAAMAGMIDHMSEQMDGLRAMFTASQESGAALEDKLGQLVDRVADLAAKVSGEDSATERLATAQEALLVRMAEDGGGGDTDPESRMRLRSIDVQMLKILEEISAGRQESTAELRHDIAALTRAIQRLAGPR